MVLFFISTAVDPPATIYMGKDKEENEELIRYGLPQDVWFHVDKLSSAHVYLRLPETIESWEKIPQELLVDCAQLVKANSIEGNRRNNLTIIYTPWDNLKKTGNMAVGQVSFHRNNRVKRVYVHERVNAIVNRLNNTKIVRDVDHEQEKIDRVKAESAKRKAAAVEKRRAESAKHKAELDEHNVKLDEWEAAELEEAKMHTVKLKQRQARRRESEDAVRSYETFFASMEYGDEEKGDGEPEERKTWAQLEEEFW